MRIVDGCRLSILVQAVLCGSIAPQHGSYCHVAALASPAAQAHTHRLYSWLSTLAYALPLPLSAFVQPHSPEVECTTVLRFLILTTGFLLPLLAEALSQAQSFACVQRCRSSLSLPPERGADAWALQALAFVTDEGSGMVTALLALLLLAATWDWVALFSIPAEHRTWHTSVASS
jgi:hypothetical protein